MALRMHRPHAHPCCAGGLALGPDLWKPDRAPVPPAHCAAYTAPPEQVVFDSDPIRVALLAGDANFAVVRGCAFRKPPASWDAYLALPPQLPASNQRAILFLHECRSADGNRFIVELERTAGLDKSALFVHGYDIFLEVFRPATATRAAAVIFDGFPFSVRDSHFHPDIRIYAGQVDPSDASHFTIRYQVGSKVGTLDGRVDNTGRLSLARPARM